ncbi:hypothetical protein BDZ85DRAFT_13765 [Elsinoe ampelina]|uniref:Uncharacterized protein n=1 Tax=Elsinoe ampelina TaxID=302913 RepID=A0A6A6GRN3_9PEZI|nr:hypothetical protein BDZ85DRAFT_13765 [Elsinoe ampelina]
METLRIPWCLPVPDTVTPLQVGPWRSSLSNDASKRPTLPRPRHSRKHGLHPAYPDNHHHLDHLSLTLRSLHQARIPQKETFLWLLPDFMKHDDCLADR